MPHVTPLIGTIVFGLVAAFLFGALAVRLRISPLIGYLVAGIVVGPFTPGFVADQGLANELAELGVILLMFGVGLHFSVRDLLSVRTVAVPGAIVQMGSAMALGAGLGHLLGWTLAAGLLFGLSLSVASTVVLLRALQERGILDTERGRIAVGWLIVEDLAMVLALVLVPALAGGGGEGGAGIGAVVLLTLGKAAAFVALMLLVGRRAIPWALDRVAHSGSRELFRLAVLAIALGTAAGAALLFGVSFALGAFFAGMILAESELSQRAAQETLPLRDAFAVLFFVSVGMLFNPSVVLDHPLELAATVAIIVLGKSIAAFGIVRAFGRSSRTALTIAASLAQIGEFSFILAALGGELGILTDDARDLILAGAIFSILFNPLLFTVIDRVVGPAIRPSGDADDEGDEPQAVTGHVVLIGHGRVGSRVARALIEAGERPVILEAERDRDGLPGADQARIVFGNAADPAVLAQARLDAARLLVVAIPESFEAGRIVAHAHGANPDLRIVARAHSDAEVRHLSAHGATLTIMGESEIARRMTEEALNPA